MKIRENISLKPFNTFGIAAKARRFVSFENREDLAEALSHKEVAADEKLTLGGGSNVLFVNDFDGTVLKNDIRGIEVLGEDADHVLVKAGAGENWHEFVLHSLKNNWAGVENLSLIPGNVGASPMQNIGAYGVEVKDVFHSLDAYHLESGEIHTFDAHDCNFGYRESVFKNKFKGQYVILSVTYKLLKKPNLKLDYGAIKAELEKMNVIRPDISSVSQAVVNIRRSKLPDPAKIGNAGSFFKNPIVDLEKFEKLKEEFPEIAFYPLSNDKVKIAAGWLIDKAGWKGRRFGDYGIHEKQALVLVNYGGAEGIDIYDLSEELMEDIYERYGINLEREVNIC